MGRFQPHELDTIQENFASTVDSANCILLRILEDWVHKKHTFTLAPTVRSLKRALNSVTVGLGVLTSKLTRIASNTQNVTLDETLDGHYAALPYLVMSAHLMWTDRGTLVDTGTIASKDMPVDYIQTEENGSVLIEIQATAIEITLPIDYQWLQNGLALKESKNYTGTSTPFLCISDADLDMHGSKYS